MGRPRGSKNDGCAAVETESHVSLAYCNNDLNTIFSFFLVPKKFAKGVGGMHFSTTLRFKDLWCSVSYNPPPISSLLHSSEVESGVIISIHPCSSIRHPSLMKRREASMTL